MIRFIKFYFKHYWLNILYKIMITVLLIVLIGMLNQIIVNNIKTNQEIDALGNRDTIFNLIPISYEELNLGMTKIQAMEIYEDIKNIENIELYYFYQDMDKRIITVNPEYYELISGDKDKEYPFAIIGYNVNKYTNYLLESDYEYMEKRYPVDHIFSLNYEFEGLINFEETMNDFVMIVSDELFAEYDDNYEENFTNRVWQMKIILDDGGYDEVYRYDYANEKANQITDVLLNNNIDVTILVSSITGIVRSNDSYSRQIWDRTKLETYSIVFLIITIYMADMVYSFRKQKYNFSIFLLNGLSFSQLVIMLVSIGCLGYIIGLIIGSNICSIIQIEFINHILNYFIVLGCFLNLILVLIAIKLTHINNISVCIKEGSY